MDPFRKNCKSVIYHQYFGFFLKIFEFFVPELIKRAGRDPNGNESFLNVFLKKKTCHSGILHITELSDSLRPASGTL